MFGHRCVYCRVINFDHAQIYVSQSVRSSVSLSAWLSVSPSVYKLPPSLVRCTSMSKFPFTIYPAYSHTHTHTEYYFGVHTIFKLGKAPFPAPNTQLSALSPSPLALLPFNFPEPELWLPQLPLPGGYTCVHGMCMCLCVLVCGGIF